MKLQHAGLQDYFKFGGFGSDHYERAQVLQQAQKRGEAILGHSVAGQHIIVIGDTPRDIQEGQALGAHSWALATGPFTAQQLQAYQPDLILESFLETAAIAEFLQMALGG